MLIWPPPSGWTSSIVEMASWPRAVLTAISNTRHGSGDERKEECTAVQWPLWGKQAEHAAEYLGKGSPCECGGPTA